MFNLGELDLGRALWAFALSLALWLIVQAELNPEQSEVFDLTVEARNVPSGLVITNQAEWRPVQVRLSAPRDVFSQLRASGLRAFVDLSRAGPGEATFPVEVVPPDPQVRVGEITPRRLTVRLEELVQKTVPVRARLEGNPPFGYRPGRVSLNPTSLLVTGPASFMRRVAAAEVDVRLEGVTGDIQTTLMPVLVDAQGERLPTQVPGLELQPPMIQVQLPITQQISYREVGVRPLLVGTVPLGYWVQSVQLDPSVVTVVGEPELLGGVEALETEPVDLTGMTDSFTRAVSLQVPPGLTLARTEPLVLSVQIGPVELAQSLRLPVSVLHLAPGLVVGGSLPLVEVTVRGPTDQGLRTAELAATVDAAGLGPGIHVLDVQVQLPERYRLESVRPSAVTVLLQEPQSLAPIEVPSPAAPPAPAPPAESNAAASPSESSPTSTPVPLRTPTPTAVPLLTPTPASPSGSAPTPAPRSPTATRLPSLAPRPGGR
ncbi:MAG TPA: CdaR family protein [Chloroflexota bacterium]|nr:CdaR family protein [Chloroflexota bacterium]